MTIRLQLLIFQALVFLSSADLHLPEISAPSNYIYPDYQSYGYGATGYSNYTTGVSNFDSRKRRVFTTDYSLTMAFTIDLVIPVPDLSTEIAVNIPFSVDFPTTSVNSGRSFSGRSLSSSSLPSRATMYKYIENYI